MSILSRRARAWSGALFLSVLFTVVLPGLFGCANPMVRKAKLEQVRKSFQERTWTARADLRASYYGDTQPTAGAPVLFKKGTRLKLWLVSKADWLKLKAYPAESDREQARGRTIIYIFADDIRAHLRDRNVSQDAGKGPGGDSKSPKSTAGKSSSDAPAQKKADDGGSVIIPASKIEELALKHLRQKINELLE